MSSQAKSLSGQVLKHTRGGAYVLLPMGKIIRGYPKRAIRDLVVGDTVQIELGARNEYSIVGRAPRGQTLERTFRGEVQTIATGIQLLAIVAALEPELQPIHISRMLALAHASDIPACIVFNKIDLLTGPDAPLLASQPLSYFSSLDIPIFHTSTHTGAGIPELIRYFEQPLHTTIALAGVSGVGKSSLIRTLIPSAEAPVGELSMIGRGRQTTTLAIAHQRDCSDGTTHQLIIDLPGVQQLGIAHLSPAEIMAAFYDFPRFGSCQYRDCTHTTETACAVTTALDSGALPAWRYEAYQSCMGELVEGYIRKRMRDR